MRLTLRPEMRLLARRSPAVPEPPPRRSSTMPLYLDEIWLDASSRESATRAYAAFRSLATANAYPPGVTLVAGPWFSNEEAKVILVLEIADHAETFTAFARAVADGMIVRRRLEPIVDVAGVDRLLAALAS